jgi:hypothetical protein
MAWNSAGRLGVAQSHQKKMRLATIRPVTHADGVGRLDVGLPVTPQVGDDPQGDPGRGSW